MEFLKILDPWLTPLGIFLGFMLAGHLVRAYVFRCLGAIFKKTKTQLDDLALNVMAKPLPLWFALGGVSAATQASSLAPHSKILVHKIVIAGFIVSITWSAARFLRGVVKTYAGKFTDSGGTTSLAENVVIVSVFVMGGLILLSNLGIAIAPILTALGVGSLAVALALQDTLSNFFSGIHIIVSRVVEVGDFVKLDGGQQGYVADIGWRATRIRELPNNIIVVPNLKLAQAVVTNFHQPDKELAVLVQVGVAYSSDLARVEEVTVEVGREVMKEVAGGIPAFEPFIRYHTFGNSSIDFTVILRGKEFCDQYLISHEFIKRLHKRYGREGIEIPFPQRVVRLQKEG